MNTRFARLLAAATASAWGDSLTTIALSVIAVVYLHATPLEVTVIATVAQLWWPLLGLYAGHLADSRSRRAVMAFAALLSALSLGVTAMLYQIGWASVTLLCVASAAMGVGEVLFSVADSASVPSVVESSQLEKANGRMKSFTSFAGFVGELAGGLLLRILGPAIVLLLDAASFLYSAVVVGRTPEIDAYRTSETTDASLVASANSWLRNVVEGLRYTFSSRLFRTLIAVDMISNLITAAQAGLATVFLLRVLDVPVAWIGPFLAAGSVGAVLGGAAMPHTVKRLGNGRAWRLYIGLRLVFGLLMALAFAGPGLALFLVGSIGETVAAVGASTLTFSLRQRVCPPELLGRLSATVRTLTWSPIPIGLLLGGLCATVFSIRTAVIGAAACYVVPLVLVSIQPLRGVRELETLDSA